MMTLLEVCSAAIRVADIHEASFVPTTLIKRGHYGRDWWSCTTQVIAPDRPETDLIYFLAISGEGTDYARRFVETVTPEPSRPTLTNGETP